MKNWYNIGTISIISIGIFWGIGVEIRQLDIVEPIVIEKVRIINLNTAIHNQRELMNCLSSNESNDRQRKDDGTIITGNAGEKGMFQYMPETWEMFNRDYDLNLDINKPVDQMIMTSIALEDGMGYHWTTYEKCGKYGK